MSTFLASLVLPTWLYRSRSQHLVLGSNLSHPGLGFHQKSWGEKPLLYPNFAVENRWCFAPQLNLWLKLRQLQGWHHWTRNAGWARTRGAGNHVTGLYWFGSWVNLQETSENAGFYVLWTSIIGGNMPFIGCVDSKHIPCCPMHWKLRRSCVRIRTVSMTLGLQPMMLVHSHGSNDFLWMHFLTQMFRFWCFFNDVYTCLWRVCWSNDIYADIIPLTPSAGFAACRLFGTAPMRGATSTRDPCSS